MGFQNSSAETEWLSKMSAEEAVAEFSKKVRDNIARNVCIFVKKEWENFAVKSELMRRYFALLKLSFPNLLEK